VLLHTTMHTIKTIYWTFPPHRYMPHPYCVA